MASVLRRRRERMRNEGAFVQVVRDHGLELLAEGDSREGLTLYYDPDDPYRIARFSKPEELDEFLDSCDPEWGVPRVLVDMRPGADVYFPRRAKPAAPEPDPELSKRAADLVAAVESERARMRGWAAGFMARGDMGRLANTAAVLRDAFFDDVLALDVDGWPEIEGMALSAWDWAAAWDAIEEFELHHHLAEVVVGLSPGAVAGSWPLHLLDWLDMVEADGYAAEPETALIRDEIESWRDRDAGGDE